MQVLLLTYDPTLDFRLHRLSESLGDDWLIASIIEYRCSKPSDDLTLATADVGIRLKAAAHDLHVLDVLDDMRLSEEPDELDQRNKHLEAEIARLKHLVPKLRLCFANGENRAHFPPPSGAAEVRDPNSMLDAAKQAHPRIGPVPGGPRLAVVDALAGLMGPSPGDVAAYNERLEGYYRDYYQYAVALAAYERQIPLNLEIRIANEGTCPAKNVRVQMHFPDGFLLCSDGDFPTSPGEPKPPTKPRGGIGAGLPEIHLPSYSSIIAPAMRDLAPPGNVSPTRIRHTESYDVELSVRSLQQGDEDELPALYAVFEHAEAVRSFCVDYRLIADNTPTPQEGQLHIICRTEVPSRQAPAS